MKFYVIWSDGRKFGPADLATLNQWAAEGRINRDTMMENAETGQTARARDVQGLVFPPAALDLGGNDPTIKKPDAPAQSHSPAYNPGQPQSYVAGRPVDEGQKSTGSAYDPIKPQEPSSQQNPYTNPPQAGSPYPRAQAYNSHYDDGSAKLINQAWILYVVGFACCCVCTPFGLYSANRAKNMGNPNANTPVIVGWILLGLQVAAAIIYGIIFGMSAMSGNFP